MNDSTWRGWMGGRGTAVLLLLLLYSLIFTSVSQKSMTVDEQGHLFRGVAYVKTGATQFLWGHPLLASSLNALPLLTEQSLTLPTDSPAWQDGRWAVAGDQFLWQLNDNPLRLIFLGRLPTIWLTMLLGALLFGWGRALGGKRTAVFALALLSFDPNFLAHGGLITSDIAVTFFMLLAVYGFWLAVGRPAGVLSRWSLVTAVLLMGLGLGGAAATKFSAAALGPMVGLLAVWTAVRDRSWRPIGLALLAGGLGLLLVWGVYRWQIRPYPAAAYWQDLAWQFDYFSRPHGAYLLGQYAQTGWWYYFPVTFLLKTPLVTLVLFGMALIRWGQSLLRRQTTAGQAALPFLLAPPAVYILISLLTPLNIGYRHLLPLLPFLYLFTAVTLASPPTTANNHPDRFQKPVRVLLALLFLTTLIAWPDYLSYMNVLAGRAENRWRLLSDSNVDWGQDLPALADWQQETGRPLFLSYFGTAHPSAYGLDFIALPTWEPGPEQLLPSRQTFNPADPAPGWYAISVTNLQGLVLGEAADAFAWFREREPAARLGGSIFVYEVAVRGDPVNAAFSGLRPADLAPELLAELGTNDVRVRWFDGTTSLIWPQGGGWWISRTDQPMDPLLRPWAAIASHQFSEDGAQVLVRPTYPPPLPWADGQPMGETAVFLGYDIAPNSGVDGVVALVTGWQVAEATERPLKIFVHALDEQGQIVGQWDGLDVDSTSWQPGDVFVQVHRFAVPDTAVIHAFAIGLYDADTLERLADPIVVESQ
ncbi:MAG: phospholipid carrier-dependent glycosyltransferase [Chloroflexi bacterium]|nr:phospholipid carrier-dependent glycosyltransferase [Chloroflexota bacterium]MBP7042037.1 phospholipid carrier-dependent glycosyltransferase [Chloroflexota bacterium]